MSVPYCIAENFSSSIKTPANTDTAVDMPTNDEALFVPIDDIDILNNTKDRTEDAIPR